MHVHLSAKDHKNNSYVDTSPQEFYACDDVIRTALSVMAMRASSQAMTLNGRKCALAVMSHMWYERSLIESA